MKVVQLMAAAVLISIASAQKAEDNFCSIVGMFSNAKNVEVFAKSLRDAEFPLLTWKDGARHYVAIGPYDDEKGAEAIVTVLRARKLIGPSNEGVVISSCLERASNH